MDVGEVEEMVKGGVGDEVFGRVGGIVNFGDVDIVPDLRDVCQCTIAGLLSGRKVQGMLETY